MCKHTSLTLALILFSICSLDEKVKLLFSLLVQNAQQNILLEGSNQWVRNSYMDICWRQNMALKCTQGGRRSFQMWIFAPQSWRFLLGWCRWLFRFRISFMRRFSSTVRAERELSLWLIQWSAHLQKREGYPGRFWDLKSCSSVF